MAQSYPVTEPSSPASPRERREEPQQVPRQAKPSKRWRNALGPVLLFGAGIGLTALMAKTFGSAQVRVALNSLASAIPALLLLEVLRFVAELRATRSLLGDHPVPMRPLLQSQCAAHVCAMILPAGRAAAEGMRTAVLAPFVGLQQAAGVGAAGQLITFVVNGGLSIVAAVFTLVVSDTRELAIGVALFGLAMLAIGLLLRAALRSEGLLHWLMRLPFGRKAMVSLVTSTRGGAAFGMAPVLWHTGSRLLQAVQLGWLLTLISGQVQPALWMVALGLQLAGAAAGDFLPAHMGATEGAFALFADPLGITASAGLSLALVLHCVQLLGTAFSLLFAIALRVHRSSPR